MPKDQWARGRCRRRASTRNPTKVRPEVAAAWARFESFLKPDPFKLPESRLVVSPSAPPKKGNKQKKWHKKRRKQFQKPKKRLVWEGNYSDYLLTNHWKETRKTAIKHHGNKCHDCGADRNLEVHHLTYKRLGREKMRDLQVLCYNCHRLRHKDKQGVVLTDTLSVEFRAIVG